MNNLDLDGIFKKLGISIKNDKGNISLEWKGGKQVEDIPGFDIDFDKLRKNFDIMKNLFDGGCSLDDLKTILFGDKRSNQENPDDKTDKQSTDENDETKKDTNNNSLNGIPEEFKASFQKILNPSIDNIKELKAKAAKAGLKAGDRVIDDPSLLADFIGWSRIDGDPMFKIVSATNDLATIFDKDSVTAGTMKATFGGIDTLIYYPRLISIVDDQPQDYTDSDDKVSSKNTAGKKQVKTPAEKIHEECLDTCRSYKIEFENEFILNLYANIQELISKKQYTFRYAIKPNNNDYSDFIEMKCNLHLKKDEDLFNHFVYEHKKELIDKALDRIKTDYGFKKYYFTQLADAPGEIFVCFYF